MSVKSKISTVIVATTLAGMIAGATNADPLHLETEGAYPPFSYIEADGNIAGFDVEISQDFRHH